ncbi:ABC transporter permease [Mycoplasmopsis ciconiae]|uniref:ABC transporter permease n=1 Tax=Mycoplasmopsis ciconiae TaxID=561067 RepID=A0ABU7MN58_9BACT|nr:ABC transporter permease [Mycoplasmopsis ciconiae]
MTSKEFNKKYGLNDFVADSTLSLLSNNNAIFNDVAGKPKKLIVEILKRFFSNWVTVLSTIIFICILIIAIFVTSTSKEWGTTPIDKVYKIKIPLGPNEYKEISSVGGNYINYLPPVYDYIDPNTKDIEDYFQTSPSIQLQDIKALINGTQHKYAGVIYQDYVKNQYIILENGDLEMNIRKIYEAANLTAALNQMTIDGTIKANISAKEVREVIANLLEINGGSLIPYTILGTTKIGIDIWANSWVGTWNAIRLALIVATIQTIIGVLIGAYLGFHVGSLMDIIVMRLIDIFVAPPSLIWLLLFATTFGTSDLTLGLALIFTGWTGSVGSTRMYVITVKDEEYIVASKSVGSNKPRLIYTHALPAIIGKIATSYVAKIPSIILSVSSLAFLGFFKSDTANLGAILSSAGSEASKNVWILLLPSLILLGISVSLHFVALGVHDALDPKVIRVK